MTGLLPDPEPELPNDEDVLAGPVEGESDAEFAAAFERLSELDGEIAESAVADLEADWPAEDLESAYRRALEANDSVEWDFSHYAAESAHDDAGEAGSAEYGAASADGATGSSGDSDSAESSTSQDADSMAGSDVHPVEARLSDAPPPQRIRMAQVVEAALFVGGEPLTSKRLCYMLKGDYDLEAIEQAIDELNRKYNAEERPYEVRLGEGGYRIVLRDEFNSVRNRVFGIGPREVKLSQDVLEVLALVAYRQPITQQEIETLGKSAPGGALRQLLRRQLIELQRDEQDRKRVTYSTTPRFLSVFGIGSIDELPQADELAFK
jgi:segregation and condensation protein B